MSVNSHDPLVSLLSQIKIHPSSLHGQYLKVYCPFHEGSAGRTLWIDRDSGSWGCWSRRCPRADGGSLAYLFYLHGWSWAQAQALVATHDFRWAASDDGIGVANQEAIDKLGLVTRAHLQSWAVDWQLANVVLQTVAASFVPAHFYTYPLYQWINVPATPGTIEHDCWMDLYYLLRRGMSPGALQRMGVGYDRNLGTLIFPIYSTTGQLRGIARRAPKDGDSYYLSGTIRHYKDPQYKAVQVKRADVLWGWFEQHARIEAGADVVVVEGYLDQVRLLGYGNCAVAKLGKNLTNEQCSLLASVPNTKIMWGDNDRDGLEKGSEDVVSLMGRTSVKAVVSFWDLKDPGDTPRLLAQQSLATAVDPCQYLQMLPQLFTAAVARNAAKA